MVEIRRAIRARRTSSFDARSYKSDLWRRLFGDDLDDALLDLLVHVDTTIRFVCIATGWIRDDGDVLYASGGDPAVVALLVAAIIAKGWTSVIVWGDAGFVAEARRQLEAAGIEVSVGQPPAPVPQPSNEKRAETELDRWKADIRRWEEERDTLEKLLVPDRFEREVQQTLSKLVEEKSALAVDADQSERPSGKFALLGMFGKQNRSSGDGVRSKLEIKRAEAERIESEMRFYRSALDDHRTRRERERIQRLKEVSNSLVGMRERIRELEQIDDDLEENPTSSYSM